MADLPELLVPDVDAWHDWLHGHHGDPAGVWLVLAKKGVGDPTRLTYDQALDEAVCYGWIDGQLRRRDDRTYAVRFTPRRSRSPWSQSNVERVGRLMAAGRMQPAGLTAVEEAKANGRWDAAYAGQSEITVPEDLAAALQGEPRAAAMFEILTRQNRFAILYRIGDARRPDTRARRIAEYVAMLARGDTPHPQRRTLPTE
ncbi:MAG TPA: YdeI/OmpD-associated family protein [Chloroflexota bacterium]|nr:YdeI/OmpD-associated family protein [Chloroflexota bacterium]